MWNLDHYLKYLCVQKYVNKVSKSCLLLSLSPHIGDVWGDMDDVVYIYYTSVLTGFSIMSITSSDVCASGCGSDTYTILSPPASVYT